MAQRCPKGHGQTKPATEAHTARCFRGRVATAEAAHTHSTVQARLGPTDTIARGRCAGEVGGQGTPREKRGLSQRPVRTEPAGGREEGGKTRRRPVMGRQGARGGCHRGPPAGPRWLEGPAWPPGCSSGWRAHRRRADGAGRRASRLAPASRAAAAAGGPPGKKGSGSRPIYS